MNEIGKIEVEVKIKIINIPNIIKKILELGFNLIEKKYFESNIVFDTADNSLKKNNFLLRLRNQQNHTFLTFKRPVAMKEKSPQYKEREEIEIKVSSFDNAKKILLSLGYNIFFVYEKFREIYQKEDVKIMIDQTPIGDFIEIEGEKEKIDDISCQLGYERNQYIVESYYSIFKKMKRSGFMVFK